MLALEAGGGGEACKVDRGEVAARAAWGSELSARLLTGCQEPASHSTCVGACSPSSAEGVRYLETLKFSSSLDWALQQFKKPLPERENRVTP